MVPSRRLSRGAFTWGYGSCFGLGLGFGRGDWRPMKGLPVKNEEPRARPITFPAGNLGPFELAQLWGDRHRLADR
jgi:hypothetical protein